MKNADIMVLDDEPMVVENIKDLIEFETDYSVLSETNPLSALNLLNEYNVDLIITDFLMPEMNGIDFLIQAKEKREDLTSIILTGYADKQNAIRAINEVGVYHYIEKPWDSDDLLIIIKNAVERGDLLKEIKMKYEELQQAYLETIYRLAITAEIFDEDTYAHILRISIFSEKLARLAGESDTFCSQIKYASMTHDVGKIGVPKEILQKTESLIKDEFEIIKQHPEIGGRILRDSTNSLLKMAQEISLFHHEKWDGKGYITGLRKEQIPRSARIVAVVDVFDALMSERPYKEAMPPEEVKEVFIEGGGRHFDPELTELLLDNFEEFIEIFYKFSMMKQEDVFKVLFEEK
jgi:putative two-component system response regulator